MELNRRSSSDDPERQALAVVSSSLRDNHLQVDVGPSIGGTRPDLVVTRDSRVFVIVVKIGEAPLHFSLLSQVLSFKSAYESSRPEQIVTAVLVTNRDVPTRIADLAQESGIQIVTGASPSIMARRLVDLVTKSGGPGNQVGVRTPG